MRENAEKARIFPMPRCAQPRVVGEGHAPPGTAPAQLTGYRQNGKRPKLVIARPQRGRGNLGEALPTRTNCRSKTRAL